MNASFYCGPFGLPTSTAQNSRFPIRHGLVASFFCSSGQTGLLLRKIMCTAFSLSDCIQAYIAADPEVTVLKRLVSLALFAVIIWAPMPVFAQQSPQEKAPQDKEQVLWQKLEATINGVDRNLEGVLGVAILDLTTGQKYFLHADEVLPTASSIKIAILAELYRQAQQGKIKLGDLYTLQSSDLAGGSGIAGALTPGVTRLTIRDVAALMISVSDNSATNIIIDRIGIENVNALLDSLSLTQTRLRRKMMDVKAAGEGRENIATPREMVTLLESLYRGRVLNKPMTEDFFTLLSVHKESYIPRELPEDLRIANKPGELEGVRNDSGIVFTGSRPFAISVMTTYLRRGKEGGAGSFLTGAGGVPNVGRLCVPANG